jgi:D-cysteine desulfhydrase family pyridoxal phosphate-dependent enzyme
VNRVSLAQLPTPLEEAPRLSEALGVHLLLKRDDLTGLALGGNKARKLEYLVADAFARGCDTLVAAGGAQSNFARMTAASAARLGMGCHLVLSGREPERLSGNLILDRLFGATLHFVGSGDWRVLEAGVAKLAGELGPGAYPMPIGGATAVGALGYVDAADELMTQLAATPDWLVLADGSGGTHAGLLAALPARLKILGVDVARPPVPHLERIPGLAAQTAQLAGRTLPGGELHLVDHAGPKYGAITDECLDAIRLAARTEGLLLDPVYSGKAMAGLRAAAREGRVSGTVVFLHTGGAPALFADGYAEAMA